MKAEAQPSSDQEAGATIPQKLMDYLRLLRTVNQKYSIGEIKEALDEHRLAAYGGIDMELEAGRITPEEAQRRKDNWDIRHSYK
jgi:hypothetical protein